MKNPENRLRVGPPPPPYHRPRTSQMLQTRAQFYSAAYTKQIFVLTVAEKFAEVQAYFTGEQKNWAAILRVYHEFAL